jgi:hypothetical protein
LPIKQNKIVMKKALSCIAFFLLLLSISCSKGSNDDDDNPGGGGGGGNVSISSLSPTNVIWGGELTINGSGFSTTKTENFVWFKGDNSCGTTANDSTDWKKAEVVSASATKLVVKVPFTTQNNLPCGNSWASVRVTVKGSFAMSPSAINCMGFPIPVGFCGWYGGGHYAQGAIRVGDSVLLEYAGLGVSNLESAGEISKLRLSVDGISVPVVLRKGISGCSRGVTFYLDSKTFGEAKCEPKVAFWGGSGKDRSFTFSLDKVPNSEATKKYFVFSLPKATYGGVTGPTTVSKALGGTPEWKVTGKDMFYNKVRFIAQGSCTGTVEAQTTCTNNFCNEFVFGIPLSLLNADCTYNVGLVDDCGVMKLVGSVKVNP